MSGTATAVGLHVEPVVDLLVAAGADLEAGCGEWLGLGVEREAEHVLERREVVAAFGQQLADGGVGDVRELDLHGGADGAEGLLDLVEGGRVRDAVEAEPGDLVERGVGSGVGRVPAGDRQRERARAASLGGLGRQRSSAASRRARSGARARCHRRGARA